MRRKEAFDFIEKEDKLFEVPEISPTHSNARILGLKVHFSGVEVFLSLVTLCL